MIAQTLVEYGALQSIAQAFRDAYYRIELYIRSDNSKYFLLLGLVFIVVLIWTRRRAN